MCSCGRENGIARTSELRRCRSEENRRCQRQVGHQTERRLGSIITRSRDGDDVFGCARVTVSHIVIKRHAISLFLSPSLLLDRKRKREREICKVASTLMNSFSRPRIDVYEAIRASSYRGRFYNVLYQCQFCELDETLFPIARRPTDIRS